MLTVCLRYSCIGEISIVRENLVDHKTNEILQSPIIAMRDTFKH